MAQAGRFGPAVSPHFRTLFLTFVIAGRIAGIERPVHIFEDTDFACIPAFGRLEIQHLFDLKGVILLVSVHVRDNNVDQALRVLKKKMQREGIFREMKLRRDYEKPSERKKREKSESVRRWRKMERKRKDRE